MSVNQAKQWFPQFLTALDRAPMAGLLCAAALLFGVALAWTRTAASPNRSNAALGAGMFGRAYDAGEKTTVDEKTDRLREGGEIVNQPGYFRTTGARLSFVSADSKRLFITLENRNLERIAQIMADNSDQVEWIVSGTISEYRGENFLMVGRAELKSSLRLSDAAK